MKKIIQAYRKWRLKRKLSKTFDFLKELDGRMKEAGLRRWERRRIWKRINKNLEEIRKIAEKMEG